MVPVSLPVSGQACSLSFPPVGGPHCPLHRQVLSTGPLVDLTRDGPSPMRSTIPVRSLPTPDVGAVQQAVWEQMEAKYSPNEYLRKRRQSGPVLCVPYTSMHKSSLQ